MSINYAPVLIATLNRYVHFKRCVESLSKCKEAEFTELFIALDYPKSESHRAGYESILSYLSGDIKGFKKINIIKRDENYGAVHNFIDAWTQIFEKYDRVIISEDDNEFSTDFLNFINSGLDLYDERDDVLSICGYNYPIKFKIEPGEYFLYQGFSAWGYGTWKKKYQKLTFDIEEIKDCMNHNECCKKIKSKFIKTHLTNNLKTNVVTGDTYHCFYQYMNSMSSLFPKVSRVRNHGHDGTGVHGSNLPKKNIYKDQYIFEGVSEIKLTDNLKINYIVNREIDKYLEYRNLNNYLSNPFLLVSKFLKIINKWYIG